MIYVSRIGLLTLALALVATVTFAAAEAEEAAAAEKEMVLDPTTGEMITAPEYGGTLIYGRTGTGEHCDAWANSGWSHHFVGVVTEQLTIANWGSRPKRGRPAGLFLSVVHHEGTVGGALGSAGCDHLHRAHPSRRSLARQGTDERSRADRQRRRVQLSSHARARQRLQRSLAARRPIPQDGIGDGHRRVDGGLQAGGAGLRLAPEAGSPIRRWIRAAQHVDCLDLPAGGHPGARRHPGLHEPGGHRADGV